MNESFIYSFITYLVYIELLVILYLLEWALTFSGHKSCVLQHISNLTSAPKSKYVFAKSPLPHHFVPTKKYNTYVNLNYQYKELIICKKS